MLKIPLELSRRKPPAALLERVVRIEGYESIAQKTTVALDNAELQSTIRELRDEEVRSEIRA